MFAEMTPGSNHTLLVLRKGFERNWCRPYEQQKSRSEKIFSSSRTKEQSHSKSALIRNCLKFCSKDQARMEYREPWRAPHAELTEGRLRELASKWFIETQVPLIVHNGLFPTWFLGFITRKDAEEILREKELGCFLVRLSDKAIGYILSYKGRDRCRHFVINQSEKGQFVVCGDNEGHDTVPDLIEYFKKKPIEPFGEYLTSSCFEVMNEELYDTIQISRKEKPVATVRAVKDVRKQQSNLPPTRPPKSNRAPEEVPPLPQRSRHFDGAPLNDQDKILYAQLMKQPPREIPRSQHICQGHLPGDNPGRAERSTAQDQNVIRCGPLAGTASVYSELNLQESTKSKSQSLPDNIVDGEYYYRLSARPNTPPRLSPKPNRQAASCVPRSEKTDSCGPPSSLDHTSDGDVYHLAGRPGSPCTASSETSSLTSEQRGNSVYAKVPSDNTYELIPGHEEAAHPNPDGNTYEPLEDVRPRALRNDKWKWLFPEVKKKW